MVKEKSNSGDEKKIPGLSLRERLIMKNPDKHKQSEASNLPAASEPPLASSSPIEEPASSQESISEQTVKLIFDRFDKERQDLETRLRHEEEQRRQSEENARKMRDELEAQKEALRKTEEEAMRKAQDNVQKALAIERRKIEEEHEKRLQEARAIEQKAREDAQRMAKDGAHYLMTQERERFEAEIEAQKEAKDALNERLLVETEARRMMEEEARRARAEADALRQEQEALLAQLSQAKTDSDAAQNRLVEAEEAVRRDSSKKAKSELEKAKAAADKALDEVYKAENAVTRSFGPAYIPNISDEKPRSIFDSEQDTTTEIMQSSSKEVSMEESTRKNSSPSLKDVLQPREKEKTGAGLRQPKVTRVVESGSSRENDEPKPSAPGSDELLYDAIRDRDIQWILENADATAIQPIRQEIIVSKNNGDIEVFKALLQAGFKIDLRAGLSLKNAISKKHWAIVDHIERISPEPGETAKTIGRYIVELRSWQRHNGLSPSPGSLAGKTDDERIEKPSTPTQPKRDSSGESPETDKNAFVDPSLLDDLEGFLEGSLERLEEEAQKAMQAVSQDEPPVDDYDSPRKDERDAGNAAALAVADILGGGFSSSERKALIQEIKRLSDLVESLTERLAFAENLIVQRDEALDLSARSNEEMRLALEKQSDSRDEISEMSALVSSLRQENEQLLLKLADFDAAISRMSQLKNELASTRETLDRETMRAEELSSELSGISSELSSANKEKQTLLAKIEELEAAPSFDPKMESELKLLRKERDELTTEREMLSERISDLELSLEERNENEQESALLARKVENLQILIDQCEQEKQMIADENESLRAECAIVAESQKPLLALNWLSGTDEEERARRLPLVSAVLSEGLDAVRKVLENSVVDSEEKGLALSLAAEAGLSSQMLEYLVSIGANPRFGNDLPLVLACENQHSSTALDLIKLGAEHTRESCFALRAFARVDDIATCRALIAAGANPNAGDGLPLREAVENGATNTACLLMYVGASLRDANGDFFDFIEADERLLETAKWVETQREIAAQLESSFVNENLSLSLLRNALR